MIKQIPNLFTLLNLIFGCLAIVSVMQSGIILTTGPEGQLYYDIPEPIWMASLFIGLSAVVDFLDGFLARALKADSAMGRELDSLADVVSFGVAPSLIIYQFLRLSWAMNDGALDQSVAWLWPSFLLAAAGAWRLARFNLAPNPHPHFKGMPVPAAGLFVASFPLLYWNTNEPWLVSLLLNKIFLYSVILILSGLMISQIPLLAMKFKEYSWANNKLKYALVIVAIVAGILLQWLAIPLVIILYVLLSLLFKKHLV
jgi:CDP-diacylglycerol---serine O-phosphatidyltransferase